MALQTNWLGMQMNLNRTALKTASGIRGKTYGIVACGRPASGVNAAVASAVREICQTGNSVVGFVDGMKGISNGEAVVLLPHLVSGISAKGGVAIGTSKLNPQWKEDALKEKLERYGISGLIAVCGTETGATMARLGESGFPVITVPKSMYNNIPGTSESIGFRTAANAMATQLRAVKESARSNNGTNLYIAEIGGLYSSALALSAGNSSESTAVFIPEEYTLQGIRQIISHSFPNREYILDRIARTVAVRGELLRTVDLLRMVENDTITEEDLVLDLDSLAGTIAGIMKDRQKVRISYGVFPVSQGISQKLMFDPYTFSSADRNPESFQVLGLEKPHFVKADKFGRPKFADVDTGRSLVGLTRSALNGCNMPSRVSLFSIDAGFDTLDPVLSDTELGKTMGYKAAELLLQGRTGEMVISSPGGTIGSVRHKEMPRDYRGAFLPKSLDLRDGMYEEAVSSQRWKSAPAIDVSPYSAE